MTRALLVALAAAILVLFTLSAPAGAIPTGIPPGCQQQSVTRTDAPAAAIPDNGTLMRTINVPETGVLRAIALRTDITHGLPADLDITLTSPAGTEVTITTDNGGANNLAFAGTLWDDDAGDENPPGAVSDTSFGPGVTEAALVPEEAMSAFIGENPAGLWTLTATDDQAVQTGVLDSWGLEYAVSTGEPVNTSAVSLLNTASTPIPDVDTLTRTFSVSDRGGLVEEVEVETDIDHTFAADLEITLTSPAGTEVTLTTDNGGGNDNVFAGTLWQDTGGTANPPGPVTDTVFAHLVPEPEVVPEEAMGAFRGEDPNGTWTLKVTDDAGGDIGTLNSRLLRIRTSSCGDADLGMTGTASPGSIRVGDAVAYALTIRNPSISVSSGMTLDVALPAGLELVSATPSQGSCTGATCALGDLQVLDLAQVTVVARATAPGTLTSTATVNHPAGDPDPADSTVSLPVTVTPAPEPGAGGGGGGAGVTPAPDAAPQLVLLAQPARLGRVRSRGLTALVGATEGGALQLALEVDRRTQRRLGLRSRRIGSLTRTLGDAGTARLQVRLTRAARAALARARSVTVALRGTLTDSAGQADTASQRVTLRR